MSQKPVPSGRKGRDNPNPFQFDRGESPAVAPPGAPPIAASAAPAVAPAALRAVSRPSMFDYLLILLGFALSLCLVHAGPLPFEAKPFITDARMRAAVSYLPELMRLPEGVILLGPIFIAVQFLLGRRQGLTTIGWLWVLAWVGAILITCATVWKALSPDTAPGFLSWVPCLWYMILGTSMGALAVVFKFLSLFSRRPAPWTHTFGAALLVWSALLAAAVLAVGRFQLG